MAAGGVRLADVFADFAKFGEAQADGKSITLKNADKWMKQAGCFTKTFTTTDTGIAFAKFKSKRMEEKMFEEYIEELCKAKKMDKDEFVTKLVRSGSPGTTGTTQATNKQVTDRLTDTKNYTGSHKERFGDDGKGKGAEGRDDIAANDGYVQGYKEKDTYDKTKKSK